MRTQPARERGPTRAEEAGSRGDHLYLAGAATGSPSLRTGFAEGRIHGSEAEVASHGKGTRKTALMMREVVVLLAAHALGASTEAVRESSANVTASQTLFADAPGVHNLAGSDVQTITERGGLGGSPAPWLINFYAPWCGHCRQYSETWRRLGRYVSSLDFGSEARPRIGALSCASFKSTCEQQGVTSYPMIKAFGTLSPKADGTFVEERQVDDLLAYIAGRLPAAAAHVLTERAAGRDTPAASSETSVPSLWRSPPPGLEDAAASLHYALETAVFEGEKGSLSQAKFVALRGVLAAISVALPSLELPSRLLPRLDAAPARRDWDEWLQREPRPSWTPACDPEGKGTESAAFTCGLWALFHSLVAESRPDGLTPDAASAAIRAFVDHFFQCSKCREHFLRMYDGCEYGRCADPFKGASKADRLVLWLWRAHNAVNARVKAKLPPGKAAKDAYDVEDPAQPWIFPSAADCSKCRDSKRGVWREKNVLVHLRKTYAATPRHNGSRSTWVSPITLFAFVLTASLACFCRSIHARLRPSGMTPRRGRPYPPGFGSASPTPPSWASSSSKKPRANALADAI